VKVAEALLKGDKDIVCTASTRMGKTLGFWLPLLFCPEGIQIVVTPLNLLRKQNAASLARAIETFKYHAIIVSPEQLMKPNGEFEKRLKNTLFTSRVISVVIDEAHCLTYWGDFHPEYQELQGLRYILLDMIPIMIASATLTKDMLTSALQLLHI
ncbi:hypothetical protein PAXRUDRAFT_63458, partial [Paxillus rubicundulus Ve08.2h10]